MLDNEQGTRHGEEIRDGGDVLYEKGVENTVVREENKEKMF